MSKPDKIRVAILDDHQSIIDGYLYRLGGIPDIEVVGTALFAEELDDILARQLIDVLILDVYVPISPENPNPYPIFHAISKWLHVFPNMSVLVISMHNQRALVEYAMEAGASGYILKDDQTVIRELGSVIRSVASGGIHFSQQAHRHLIKQIREEPNLSSRQLEALSLCAAYPDAKTAELAAKMGVAHSTYRNFLSGAYLRLNAHSRMAAVAKARQQGLITSQDLSLHFE